MSDKCNTCCNLGIFGACNRRQTTGGSWTCNYMPHTIKIATQTSYRPYKSTDEMVSNFKDRFSGSHSWEMPMIWLKSKNNGDISLIVKFESLWVVMINTLPISMWSLFENFTYLDGSPVGVMNYGM